LERIVPERRPRNRGSFGGHFDGLVTQFPTPTAPDQPGDCVTGRSAKLQEKIDIHALLFERAWQLEG
jgi:hypothetical protein